jgi:hypothetical protein
MQSKRANMIVRLNTNQLRRSAVDTLEAVLIFSPLKAGVRYSISFSFEILIFVVIGSDVYLKLRCLDEAGDSKI